MQAAVASLEPESLELKSKAALAVVPKPLFRYSDPTPRIACLDAAVWRLGAEGRPTALVTVEIYQAPDGSRVMSYEFLSLTKKQFSLKHKTEAVRWDATASGLDLKELPRASEPAATDAARLAQMREMARRFAAKERYTDGTTQSRLVAQPIDRYQSETEKIVDGAIFVLANGTNPEIGIVLEADGARWRYGIIRFCSAEATVTLDGKDVVVFERFSGRGGSDGSYNLGSYRLGRGQ